MKKLLLSVVLALSLLTLFACTDGREEDRGNQTGTVISSTPQIVCNDDLGDKLYNELYNQMTYKIGSVIQIVSDTQAQTSCEIVIGDTNRDISEKAYLYLSRVSKESDTDVAYLLYSDGSSVALAYEKDKYDLNAAAIFDIDYFIDEMLPTWGESALEQGIIAKGSIDPIEYQQTLDDEAKDAKWLALEASAGKEVVEATKEYYALYSNKLISWIADLYDPETGAFYFSNSGRNTEGYLPDIEATYDVLSMIENSGMVDHLGGSYKNLPDWFLLKMGNWVKSLQDPNGYFYHPQWGKDLTNTKPNRRSRDLSYGYSIMVAAGLKTTYDTPTGAKGDYTLVDGTKVDKYGNPAVEATSALTHRLSLGTFTAVSKVVPTSTDETYVADYLKDAASFEAYLYTLDLKNDSYVVGNRLSNQVSEIKARDQQLGGALVKILEKWLIEFQNPANGMWEWRSEADPTYSDYDGVNGILKLLTLFNVLGIEYPNPIPAVESIIKAIYNTEDVVGSVCYPYNSWYALDDLFKNLRTHSDDLQATNKVITEIRERLRADAPNLIRMTAEKVALFIKQDSSSSFGQTESSATSQGMRVCVPHTNEGDTNGTLINTFGTLNHMFSVLGWSNPSMFGVADYYRFMNMIENQTEVIKDKEPDPVPVTFDDDEVGGESESINTKNCYSTGERAVISDPTDSGKGNVFKFESIAGAHDVIYIPCNSLNLTASCYIFESDYYISTDMEGYFSKIYVDSNYFIGMVIYDGVIHFIDSSSAGSSRFEQDLGFTARLEEWFNLRIEYYVGDVETVRIKTYLNGECVAVSDNYYDAGGYGTPVPFYEQAKVEAFTGAKMTVLMDNVLTHKSNAVYKEEIDPENQPAFNVDAPDRDEMIYDFEDTEPGESLPDGWSSVDEGSTVSVIETADGHALSVNGSSASTVDIPINIRTKEANVFVFETDITVNSFDSASRMEIMFRDKGIMDTAIIRFWLQTVTEEDETYLAVYEASGGILGSRLDVKIPIGQNVKLKIEYYEDRSAALIYVDGTLLAFSSAVEAYAVRATVGKIQIKNLGTGGIDITADNVKAEKNVGSFDQAVKPSVDSVTHSFESGLGEGCTLSGAQIVNGVGGNMLVSFANGGTLTLPVNRRSVATGAFIFNATLNIPSDSKDGDTLNIIFTDADGNIIIKYMIKVAEGSAKIYEVTENKTYSSYIASISLGADIPFAVEYYKQKDIAQIFVSNVCVSVTSLTYSQNSGELDAAYVILDSSNGGANITVDNVVIESYNKFFTHQVASGSNSENNSETLGFETSTTGKLPQHIKTDLRTASAAVRIKEMILRGTASKVLAFESSAGANDKLYFNMASGVADRTVTVFETDMYLDIESSTTTYEIYLTNTSGNHSYLMLLSLSGGKLNIGDVTGASSALVPGRIFGTVKTVDVSEQEWFNLRVEYYSGDHSTVRIKTYVNDELVYVSSGYYGRSSTVYGTKPTASAINRVLISSYGALVGTMYLDNMCLTRENILLADDPLTYTPKEAEPDLPNDEDGAEVLTFESSVTGNLPGAVTKELKSVGGALAVKEVVRLETTSKVMAFTTTGDTGDQLYIAKTKTLSGYNALEFSTKIAFEEINSSTALYIYFRSGSTVITRIVMTVGPKGDVSFNDYYNKVYSISTADGTTDLSAYDWATLKFTLYSYNGSCRLRIDLGDYSVISTNSSWDSLTPDKITSVRIDTSTTSDATALFDDVSLQEKLIEIPEETPPHEHEYSDEWSYDEDNHWHKATCSDNAECSTSVNGLSAHDFGDGSLCACGYEKPAEVEKTSLGYFDSLGGYDSTGATTTWEAYEKPGIIKRTNGYMSCDVDTVSSTTPYFNIIDINGNTAIAIGTNKWCQSGGPSIGCYYTSADGDCYVFESDVYFGKCAITGSDLSSLKISFYDADGNQYALRTVNALLASTESAYNVFGTEIAAETWVNIGVEYYPAQGTVKYYVNGVLAVTDTVEPTDAAMSYVKLNSSAYMGSYVAFDDLYFGNVKKHLTESEEYYTFNDGTVPSGITTDLRSTGSSLTVSDAPCLNTTEKALTLTSKAGGEDFFFIKAEDSADATKVVFETKYFADLTATGNQRFDFRSNGNTVSFVCISMYPSGKIEISDYYKDGDSTTDDWSFSTVTVDIGNPGWIDLKLVGYVGEDGNWRTEVYINGDLKATSTHAAWSGTTVEEIDGLRYYAFKTLEGKIYFDDLRLAKISEVEE